jgi:hypothetical protein
MSGLAPKAYIASYGQIDANDPEPTTWRAHICCDAPRQDARKADGSGIAMVTKMRFPGIPESAESRSVAEASCHKASDIAANAPFDFFSGALPRYFARMCLWRNAFLQCIVGA